MEHTIDHDCGARPHAAFKHILPFLAIPIAIGVMRGFAHHRFAHMSEHSRDSWKNGVPPMFAEFHRRAHAAEAAKPAPAGPDAEA